jgi:hypothetical protein
MLFSCKVFVRMNHPAASFGFCNRIVRSTALLFAASLLLGGCVNIQPSRIPISGESLKELGPVNGIVGLRQQEIQASAVSGEGYGELTSLLINNRAEKDITFVRDALVNYQPGDVLATDLRKTLATLPGFALAQMDTRQITDNKNFNAWAAELGNNSVLLVDLNYSLNPAFTALEVGATVWIHPGTGRLAGTPPGRPDLPSFIYFNSFGITVPFPSHQGWSVNEIQNRAQQWSQNDGQTIRSALNSAFQELAAMIAYDLTHTPAPANNQLYDAPVGAKMGWAGLSDPPAIHGYIEHNAGGRIWVRSTQGELYAIDQ